MLSGTGTKNAIPAALASLGTRLRELRRHKALTQREVSRRSGLPASHISRIENGYRLPSLETLERLTSALQVPVYVLFYRPGFSQGHSNLAFRTAVMRVITRASKIETSQEQFLLGLKTVLPKLTQADCSLILATARKMARTEKPKPGRPRVKRAE